MGSEIPLKKCKEFSILEACSNNGVCDELTGSCICKSGWSSIGDFSTVYGVHCSINVTAIRVLWIPALIVSPILFYLSANLLYIKIKTARIKKKKDIAYDLSIIVTFAILICAVANSLLSLLKIIDPERFAIGYHYAASIVFYIFYISTVGGGYLYLKLLAKFILGFLRVISSDSKLNIQAQKFFVDKLLLLGSLLAPIFNFAPIANVIFPNNDYAFAVALLAYGLVFSLFMVSSMFHFLRMIENEIEKHLKGSGELNLTNDNKHDPLITFKANIRKSKNSVLILGIYAISFYVIMLSWDILVINTSYLWPNMSAIIASFFCYAIISMKNNATAGKSNESNHSRDSKRNLEVVPVRQSTNDQQANSKITVPASDVEKNPNDQT